MSKYYLKDGDEIIADSARVVMRTTFAGGDLVMVCVGTGHDCNYFYNGKKVKFDSNSKAYIE